LNSQLKEYFAFARSERTAIVVVAGIILLLLIYPSYYRQIHSADVYFDSTYAAEIKAFLNNNELTEAIAEESDVFFNPDRELKQQTPVIHNFDPNNLDEKGWEELGFSPKQAVVIVRYRAKAGRFNSSDDLKKIFVISPEMFSRLELFIKITEAPPQSAGKPSMSNTGTNRYVRSEAFRTELNSADSSELVAVYGIGPSIAKRIIKYREKLGGYASAAQLKEVWGIDSVRFNQISEGVFADATVVRKININRAALSELRQHPYIDYYVAKAIVDNRIKKGAYASPDDLKTIPLIYDALFNKLRPYLTVEE